MIDLIERLRGLHSLLGDEAADEIERQRVELIFLRAASEARKDSTDIWRQCSLAMYKNRHG